MQRISSLLLLLQFSPVCQPSLLSSRRRGWGAAAGGAAGAVVGGPVGAGVGAAIGGAAGANASRRDPNVVIERREVETTGRVGCSTTTKQKTDEFGDTKTKQTTEC